MKKIYGQYMYSYPHKTAYRPLPGIDLRTYLGRLNGVEDTLYFHLPFCETKCGYCNLFSVTGKAEDYFARYIDAMERQCRQYALNPAVSFRNLVLGGGTPLLLSIAQLERVFDLARIYAHTNARDAYTVIETSPNQTTVDKLVFLKEVGVKRVSIGVQSFCQGELDALCRNHTPQCIHTALQEIKKRRFSCVNIDLIYGIPNQTLTSLQYSLDSAVAYAPEEIFIYPLYVQPQTLLAQQGVKQHPQTYAFYWFIRNYLIQGGYRQTSMRRFVRRETMQESSCGFARTVAIGCGGRSYIDDLHFCTPYARTMPSCRAILESYIACNEYLMVQNGYLLNEDEQKRRFIIKNLLYHQGIDPRVYQQIFGNLPEVDFPQLVELKRQGNAKEWEGFFKLTPKGLSLSDTIGRDFISDEVRERMAVWNEH